MGGGGSMRKGGPEVGGVPIWDGFCTDGGPEVGGGVLKTRGVPMRGVPYASPSGRSKLGTPPVMGKRRPESGHCSSPSITSTCNNGGRAQKWGSPQNCSITPP